MKYLIKKLYLILVFLIVLVPLTLITIDYLGVGYLIEKVYRNLNKETLLPNHANLYKFNYYDQKLKKEPYEKFGAYPHPFYLTGNPFKSKQIELESANKIVSLNKYGFRNSYSNKSNLNGIILGGSTAFGIFATNDFATINSYLNKKQNKINFHNLGVPSWNSHQELLALLKNEIKNVKIVLSLSGWNDFGMYYSFCKNGYEFQNIAGAPSVWMKIENILLGKKDSQIKNGFVRLFPISTKILKKINLILPFVSSTSEVNNCNFNKNDIDLFVKSYLKNYKKIKKIVESENSEEFTNANFYLVLQPFYTPKKKLPDYSDILNKKNKEVYYENYFYFISEVLKSDFCKKNTCLNLTGLFNSLENENPMIYQNLDDIKNAYLVDPIHFTDRGNDFVASIILKNIF